MAIGSVFTVRAGTTGLLTNVASGEQTYVYDTPVDLSADVAEIDNSTFRLQTSGDYLLIGSHGWFYGDIGNNNRHVMRDRFRLGGASLDSICGMASGYGRDSGAADESQALTIALIRHTVVGVPGTADDITVHTENFGDTSVSLADQFANRSSLQIIKVGDGTLPLLKVSRQTSLNLAGTAPGFAADDAPFDADWQEIVWETQHVESDSSVLEWTSGSGVAAKEARPYLVLMNAEGLGDGSTRKANAYRLTLDDTEVRGTRQLAYLRGSDGSLEAWNSWGAIVGPSAAATLKLEAAQAGDVNNSSVEEACMTVLALPTGADWASIIHSANRPGETTGPYPFDDEDADTKGIHDPTTNNSRLTLDGNSWLTMANWWARTAAADGTRVSEHFRWSLDGTVDDTIGSGLSYHRGDQGTADTRAGGRNAARAWPSENGYVEIDLRHESGTGNQNRDFIADRVGIFALDLDSLDAGGGGATNADAEAATATGSASDARTTIAPGADTATATSAAQDARTAIAPTAEAASATGAAQDATAGVEATASPATATGSANDARAAVAPTADLATATGTAYDATVTTASATNADAGQATGTGAASPARAQVAPTADQASAAGTASSARAQVAPSPDLATAAGQAFDATVSAQSNVDAPAGLATGTGTAVDARATVAPRGDLATATGQAYDAAVSTTASPEAGLATATGTAHDATVVTEPAFRLSLSPNIAPSGEDTTARLTAGTGGFGGGRIQDDENPADSVDPAAGVYLEYEWAIEATGSAVDLADYEFRVTWDGQPLDTYTSIAEWTVQDLGETVDAGLATGTGTAYDASVVVSPSADQATATGDAEDATAEVAPTAQPAAGTGTAYDATASTASNIAAQAEPATATGQAFDASTAVSPTGDSAAGTGQAEDASTEVAPTAGQASATGQAYDATVAITQGGEAEAATALGVALDARAAIAPSADQATATGQAFDATVRIAPSAGAATATGSALDPSSSIDPNADTITVLGIALPASLIIAPSADLASGIGQAFDATVSTTEPGAPATAPRARKVQTGGIVTRTTQPLGVRLITDSPAGVSHTRPLRVTKVQSTRI